jgi:hypothetical protein
MISGSSFRRVAAHVEFEKAKFGKPGYSHHFIVSRVESPNQPL